MEAENDGIAPEGTQPGARQPYYTEADEVIDSFAALRESVSQGRDLKKKRRALEEYRKTLGTLKSAYADRCNIAENFDSIIASQNAIIKATEGDIESASREVSRIEERIDEANESLSQLKRAQARERRPLEEELDRCKAAYASIKDELKQVKAQRDSLDLFESDASETAGREEAHDAVVERVNEKLDAAKAAQRDAQKALDAREKEERNQQKKALDGIKHLDAEKDKAAKRVDELEKRLAAARDRIAFCRYVIEHPGETEDMAARIAENERTADEMDGEIRQLASIHERSKAASTKARTAIIVGAVVVVIIIAVFIFVANH